ncbi:MAG: TGS domain-containing protein, partial [Nanoarchaeota archaeon]
KQEIQIALGKQLSGLKVQEKMIEDAISVLGLEKEKPHLWTETELKNLAVFLRKLTKPMLIACNKIDVPGAEKNFERLKLQFPAYDFVPCSAESELALREAAKAGLIEYVPGEKIFALVQEDKLNGRQKQALSFIQNSILTPFQSTGVQRALDRAVFDLLKYIAIFPGGVSKLEDKDGRVLPDCFLMPPGSTALDFAYKLHTDLGKNFICAKDVRTKKTIGKDYMLKHLDIIEIVAGK